MILRRCKQVYNGVLIYNNRALCNVNRSRRIVIFPTGAQRQRSPEKLVRRDGLPRMSPAGLPG
jgi:hypothetical protein